MTMLTDISPLAIHRIIGQTGDSQHLDLPKFDPPMPSRIGDAGFAGSRSILLLAPTCWLVVDRTPPVDTVIDMSVGADFTVIDESGAWRLFRFSDVDAGEILAKYCPLDLEALETGRPHGLVSHLAGHPVVILINAAGHIEIMVPRSYAASLLRLIGTDVSIDGDLT